ncbi:MAG: MopE-related protein [Kofleriaceae bacterium]
MALLGAVVACGGGDATPDASPVDAAAPDAGVACVIDADCSNGFFCDGEEVCVDQTCRAGVAPVCDDGIACTTDVCSEELRECVAVPKDADGDGRADATCLDADGGPFGDDCDDEDGNRFPGNLEICDAADHDEDCDPQTYGRVDVDGDGFDSGRCCNDGNCGPDCDDLRADVRPGATEACDAFDNDCDSNVDEGVAVTVYADLDGDGFGAGAPMAACAGTPRTSATDTDCDDADVARHPGQLEVCDGKDNNCDAGGLIDEDATAVPWYPDADGDGFGDPAGPVIISCVPPMGHALLATDCDDSMPSVSPVAAELCDGRDNDCNGLADFRIGTNDFEDDDGDGLVDIACVGGTDCDDADGASGPAAIEQCDGRDNDCDSNVDEGANDTVWYRDLDGDGYGSAASGTVISCEAPPGFSALGGDCADSNPARTPGGLEACDGADQDCDGAVDESPAGASCGDVPHAVSACSLGGCVLQCLPGFFDCDGNYANGCEADLSADADNCGTCGQTCGGRNQTGTCVAGACECAGSFADCNGNPGDGCEIDTSSNLANCGACDAFCSPTHGAGTCEAGTCQVAICFPGWDDCDATPGCETNVTTDTQCGSCGNDCTALPGVMAAACVGGNDCQITACQPGLLDCDGSHNGCETDPLNSPQHCGGCFNSCSRPGQSGVCTAGACECAPGFEDCDGDPNNGCEANLLTDPNRCGSCTTSCFVPGQNGNATCTSGTCDVSCQFGWGDCAGDGDPLTCETRLDTVDDCGACGTSCTTDGSGQPFCDGGPSATCTIFCNQGRANCDSDPTDCEIDSNTDENNCGGCGNVCGPGGTCEFGICDGVKQVAVGENFTCVVRQRGGVACWGDDTVGQLGNGAPFVDSATPVEVAGLPQATGIYAGARHVCATTNGGLYCWGDNTDGQLGNGTAGGSFPSPQFISSAPYVRLGLGGSHTCGLTNAGVVRCWGKNTSGQIGTGSVSANEPSPVAVVGLPPSPYFNIAAGTAHSCVQGNNNVYCWGDDSHGQLGDSGTIPGGVSALPVQVTNSAGAQQIHVGDAFGCLIRYVVGPIVECWGEDTTLQLADDASAVDQGIPVSTFVSDPQYLTLGAGHGCAIDSFGSVACWGDNAVGQLGRGTTGAPTASPVTIGAFTEQMRDLSGAGTGSNHTCAITFGGQLWCWGDNSDGQLGADPVALPLSATPVHVAL